MEITIYNRGDFESAVEAMKDSVEEAGFPPQFPPLRLLRGTISGFDIYIGNDGVFGQSKSGFKRNPDEGEKLAKYIAKRKVSKLRLATRVEIQVIQKLLT